MEIGTTLNYTIKTSIELQNFIRDYIKDTMHVTNRNSNFMIQNIFLYYLIPAKLEDYC